MGTIRMYLGEYIAEEIKLYQFPSPRRVQDAYSVYVDSHHTTKGRNELGNCRNNVGV
jgi:hypothetical protein